METMKVSSIVKSYPNQFVVACALQRNSNGAVGLAHVLGTFSTKQEAIVQQTIFEMVGIKSFLIPTFEEMDDALQITISGDEYKSEPLLTPAETAKMYRQYWGFE